MLSLTLNWLFSAALIFLTSQIIRGFQIPDFTIAMITSLFIGLTNIMIRPLLCALAFPVNLVTLGLFSLVINAVILRLVDDLMNSFSISGWGPALLVSFYLASVQAIVYLARSKDKGPLQI